jgi:hypothetical protein
MKLHFHVEFIMKRVPRAPIRHFWTSRVFKLYAQTILQESFEYKYGTRYIKMETILCTQMISHKQFYVFHNECTILCMEHTND